jgi:hypothetical protein
MADSRIEKWRRWCAGRIRDDILTMHLHRHVFREVGEITKANSDLPASYFFDYLQDTYATTQAIAIRRQAETGTRVCTLGRLLTEISDDPSRISREFYVGMWDADQTALGAQSFDAQFAGVVGSHIDPAIIRHDLEVLNASAESVKGYVDQYVAHSDARASAALPAFEEMDSAIDSIGHLFVKYVNALTADIRVKLVPEFQHDWLAVFRKPWIRS